MEEDGRDSQGRFIKGRNVSLEEKRKKAEGMRKHYEVFIPSAKLRSENPHIFNSWRAMLYTQKGKSIGCDTPEWKVFENFYADVSPTYKPGLKFCRIDTTLPFSKDNFMWMTLEEVARLKQKSRIIYLDYNGEHLTIDEIAYKYNVSAKGIRMRIANHKKDYTVEDLIFGKRIKRGDRTPKDAPVGTQLERNKASKMISTYRCRDKKFTDAVCDIDIEWMIENILHKPCVYCGDTHKIGCDRIDNGLGHTKANVVPCCYGCNSVRNNTFTYEEMLELGKTIKTIKEKRKEAIL